MSTLIRGTGRLQVREDCTDSLLYVQGLAKRWSPGCVNAVGKARLKW